LTNTRWFYYCRNGRGIGTAAAIAQLARKRNFTVGIVTPILFEGKSVKNKPKIGNENHVNKSIFNLINNNKLREVYGNLGFKAGFQSG
jgi:cell division protein FtsZ